MQDCRVSCRLAQLSHQQRRGDESTLTGVCLERSLREAGHGRLGILFFVKKNLAPTPKVKIKVQTGFIPVSSPEATPLDLLRYARRIGGLNGVFTILHELQERMDGDRLVEAAKADGDLAV